MIGSMIAKEILLLLRDRGALLSMFAMPVAFIAFFGFIFKGMDDEGRDPDDLPALVLCVSEDSPWGARLQEGFERGGSWRVAVERDPAKARSQVARGRARAGLIVPAGWNPLQGPPAELSVDEALSPQVLLPLRGAIEGTIGALLAPPGSAGPRRFTEVRTPPGIKRPMEGVDSFQISVPGNAVLFIFFLALGLAMSFVEERKSGSWRRLLAAPVSRPALLMAKLVPFFIVGTLQMAFFLGLGVVGFGMGVAGSVVGLLLLTLAVVFAALGLGLLVASFGGTEKQVAGISSIVVLVMGLAGGCMVPRLIMPAGIQKAGLFTPHAWALDGYYDLLIREGTTTADVLPQILALVGFGCVFSAAGCLIFRFER